MSQTVVLKVTMACGGCSGAVQRALGKMEGVESFDVNLKEQKVTVTGNVTPEAVFETVSKTGKKTAYWEEPVPAPAPEAVPEPTPAQASETVEPAAPEPAPVSTTETAKPVAPEAVVAPKAEAEAETKTAEPVPVAAA